MNKIPERGNFEKGKMKYIIKISLIMERLHSRGLTLHYSKQAKTS